MTLSTFQRQSIINQIRAMFAIYNGNNPAPSFIENLWANMTPEQLYMALGNFTRMAL
jgi:hypothetical protein